MIVALECLYCGHKWRELIYNQGSLSGKTCRYGTCRHKELKVEDISKRVDYYKGSPSFPEKNDDYFPAD